MDLVLIENLLRLLERSCVHELEVSEGGVRIRVAKASRNVRIPLPNTTGQTQSPQAEARAQTAELPALPPEPSTNEHRVAAGLTGTFYRSSSPDAAPFVQEGDAVEDGQTLGMIEAMKSFNPVEADCAGRIAAILVTDGSMVSPGMPLFILKKADEP